MENLNEQELLEKEIQLAIARDEINSKKNLRFLELQKMPFHLRMQEEENKQKLKALEYDQEETMRMVLRKRHPHLKLQVKELFGMYFMDFLAGKATSINDFLYRDKNGSWNDENLKNIFKV